MSVSAPGTRGGAKQGGGWGLLFQRSKWAVSVPWTGLGCGLRNVPHKSSLPEGIRPGTVMRIRGLVPSNASRFHVNLLCGEEQGSDAALHFNPRLDTSEVVFNSKEQGSWGREERGPGVPFQRGQPFEVLIIASDDGFKAVVGDAQYHHFRHRLPLARVRLVEVGGDVQLDSVRIF
ncbi:galectin-7 [Pan paniscus]|uniref:galectin-7 n=1 Tax=Pan paniscus TaxID=9597 RepID=UPI00155FE078|nr:galectin-7 [Pan paniscus]